MHTERAFRQGSQYSLSPLGPDAEEIILALLEDVHVAKSSRGEQLLYRVHYPYGQPVRAALSMGWCWVVGQAVECER